MIFKQLPNVLEYNKDGGSIDAFNGNGSGGGGGSVAPQNDYVQRSELADVAFTGDYDDLADKPSNISANNIFEPINVSVGVSNSSLLFTLRYSITENSYFILNLKTLGTINVNINNGIILRYINTDYFNGTDIILFNDDGEFIDGADMPYIKSYIANRTLLCYLHDGRLWIKRISLKEFANGFGENQYLKQPNLDKAINSLEVSPINNPVGEIYYNTTWNDWYLALPSDVSIDDFCTIILTDKEHDLVPTHRLNYNAYPAMNEFPCVELYNSFSNDYSLLLCVRNIQSKTFLLQGVKIDNVIAYYKLFDLDYFSYIFGFCYISSYNNVDRLAIILPYNKNTNVGSNFILETHLESDLTDMSTCTIIGKNNIGTSGKQIRVNNSVISNSNPLKKDCYYVCTIYSQYINLIIH